MKGKGLLLKFSTNLKSILGFASVSNYMTRDSFPSLNQPLGNDAILANRNWNTF